METKEQLEALVEVNISTDKMLHKLRSTYRGWNVLYEIIKPLTYKITRMEKSVLLKTNAITYVVRKNYS